MRLVPEVDRYTHIVPDDFPTVRQQIHELGDAHGIGQDPFLDIFTLVGQKDSNETHCGPSHMEIILLGDKNQDRGTVYKTLLLQIGDGGI